MKLGRLLFGLFALSTLIGVAVFAVVAASSSRQHAPMFVALVFIMWIHPTGSLLGIWVAMGGSPAPWRFMGATLALALCVVLCRTVWGEPLVEEVVRVPLFYMVATSLPLLLARALGLRLQHFGRRNQGFVNALVQLSQAESGGAVDRAAVKRRWPQWSLSSILLWTTAIAVLLSTLTSLNILHEFLIRLPMACIGLFIVTLFELWIVLGTARAKVKIIVFGLVVGVPSALIFLVALCVAGAYGGYLYGGDVLGVLIVVLVPFLWLLGLLYIVRAAGYRLTWGVDARD